MRRRARTRPATPRASRGFDESRFHLWLEGLLGPTDSAGLRMGDDVASVGFRGAQLLLTTDALSEGTHFRRGTPPSLIGRAAVAASLSDLASKGGTPLAVLLDLLLPPRTPEAWARAVVTGADTFASKYGCRVVGGDTKGAPGRSVVGTILGWSSSGRLPARHLARPGDRLVTTGHVGAGGAAARRLLDGSRLTAPDLRRMVTIHPRIEAGRVLAPLARAMIDTSDGLADAATSLAHASDVRVVLDLSKIPFHPQLARIRDRRNLQRLAFYGGDYELLAAIPPDRVKRALQAVRTLGERATVIGAVERGRGAFLSDRDVRAPIPIAGWDPFRATAGA